MLSTNVHLSPRGDFTHAHGIQRLDESSMQTLVAQFQSFRAKWNRGFRGLPIYVGHPDAPDLSHAYPDKKIYGRIVRLRTDSAGLFGEVEWSEEAKALSQRTPYRFLSPYWEAEEIAVEQGRSVLQPIRLISAGLTNKPNLPVLPFVADPAASPVTLRRILENALFDGRITPAQLPVWTQRLANDLSTGEQELQQIPPTVHTRSITSDFGKRRLDLASQENRSKQLAQLMAEHVRKGLTYDQAWLRVKQDHPALFAEMHDPNSAI